MIEAVSDRFDEARPRLRGIAYRILGIASDADDVSQDAWIRWNAADQDSIDNVDAWLTTVATRLSLDRLRRRKREEDSYVGPWLPSPLVTRASDPADVAEMSDSMTTAFLLLLEQLTPDERAAFLLADVFGESFDSIATTLDRTTASCRQLASRGRRKLRSVNDERRDDAAASGEVVARFLAAIASGDERTALSCLNDDVVYLGDGGPDHRAARRPVRGPDRLVRLVMNLWGRIPPEWSAESALVGGFPGVVIDTGSGVYSATSFEVVDGRIIRVLSTVNPDKLAGTEVATETIE
jgi:RNA polymerase sigma-70 factor (ECF subfamily)